MASFLRRHPLAAVLCVALAVRLLAVAAIQHRLESTGERFVIAGDAEGYWLLAAAIARGDEYSVYDPPRRILRMPGFPLLLAPVWVLFGDSLLAARVLLAVLGTATCAAVYALGRTLDTERTGLLAATAAALWPTLVAFSGIVLSETPFALFLTLSLVAMAKLIRRSGSRTPKLDRASVGWAVAIGLLITTATFLHPTWLPAAVVFPLLFWLWAKCSKSAAALGAIIILSAALPFLPWVYRNFQVSGHPVVTTLWVGPSLYDALNPQATGASDMRFFEEDRLMFRMSEYEMDQEYRRRTREFVSENPGRVLQLAAIKLWRFWRPDPSADQFSAWPLRLLVAGAYLPMLLLAITGAWFRRRELWTIVLTIGPIVAFSLVHAVFIGSLRYRLPAEYPLCVLSAIGLQTLWPRFAPHFAGHRKASSHRESPAGG